MTDKQLDNGSPQERKFQIVVNLLMVSVMLACFAFIIGRAIHAFYPAWGIYWFPVLTLILSFLSLLMRYSHSTLPQTQQNPYQLAIVEFILIILIAKLVSLLNISFSGGPGIWEQILSWPQNFMENFFNPDTLVRASSLILVWFLTWAFSAPLNQLEEDEALMEQEKLGYTFTDRYQARRNLINLVFTIGIAMILITVVSKSNLALFSDLPSSNGIDLVVLMFYFVTAFLFLAINQYAIMKARWYFSDIPVNPDLAKRWIYFSIIFILVVILVIVFLPTNFSFGLSSIVQWLADAIYFLISLITSIIIAPFILLMMFVESLFSSEPLEQTFEPIPPEPPSLIPQTTGAMPWWDVVRSIIFWLVFNGTVVIIIRYYVNNKPNLKNLFSEMKLIGWLRDFWRWLIRNLREVSNTAKETLGKGVDKIQGFLKNQQIKLPSLIDVARRLPPRQAVILIYIDWIHWNSRHGFARKTSQTPIEYARAYRQYHSQASQIQDQVNGLTEAFLMARYSRQTIQREQAQAAQAYSKQLKNSLLLQQDLQDSQL
jgi:hypothetical protein